MVTSAQTWIGIVAIVGQLALALLAFARAGSSPLGLPLGMLCLDLFAWSAAAQVHGASGVLAWRWLDLSASPLTAPLALQFILAFVGKARSRRPLQLVLWAAFGLLSAAGLLAFVVPAARAFAGSVTWAALHLALALPTMLLATGLLVVHLRHQARGSAERARTRSLLLAVVFGTALLSTEMWRDVSASVPALGEVGLFICTLLMARAAMDLRLLEEDLSISSLGTALFVAGSGALLYVALFRFVASHTVLLLFATALVALALASATREVVRASTRRRARTAQLTTLGRFASQLSHDLKNPLAALKGAAQYLQEDLTRRGLGAGPAVGVGDGAAASPGEFVTLMLEQIERLHATIDRYSRLAQLQPLPRPLELNGLVRDVLTLQPFVAAGRVTVRAELAPALPLCEGDRDLLGTALENLVRNAIEAIPAAGEVVVRTARAAPSERPGLTVSVEDTGTGMDARRQERAFDEFFTTKAQGSGLGLPFVRRVVEAHGGQISLSSEEGRGTIVRFSLPCSSR